MVQKKCLYIHSSEVLFNIKVKLLEKNQMTEPVALRQSRTGGTLEGGRDERGKVSGPQRPVRRMLKYPRDANRAVHQLRS